MAVSGRLRQQYLEDREFTKVDICKWCRTEKPCKCGVPRRSGICKAHSWGETPDGDMCFICGIYREDYDRYAWGEKKA